MRRRIDTFQSVTDATKLPHLYLNRYDGDVQFDDPPLALYDESLWQELQQAQAALRSVELMRGQYDADRCTEIECQLVAHAATLERK